MTDIVQTLPANSGTVTTTAVDWRDQTAFCFVSFGVPYSETYSGSCMVGPSLLDTLQALEAAEDQIDGEAASVALIDNAELPTISWAALKAKVRP